MCSNRNAWPHDEIAPATSASDQGQHDGDIWNLMSHMQDTPARSALRNHRVNRRPRHQHLQRPIRVGQYRALVKEEPNPVVEHREVLVVGGVVERRR